MHLEPPRILCIDDDRDTSQLIEFMLLKNDPSYQVTSISTPDEALLLAQSRAFDLYLLDYRYPTMTGIDICRQIREIDARTPILFFTGSATSSEREAALRCGANVYLIKPDDLDRLTATIARLLREHHPLAPR